MTSDDLAILQANLDGTVEITLVSGETISIRPIIVVDEPPTPDLFYLELESKELESKELETKELDPHGAPRGSAGKSILLADIESVRVPA